MDGFERRKEQSKEDIRQAAWELFSQFGVDRVTIADIARKAGISQATIYNNFGSKDAIVREFVSTSVEQLITRVEQVLTPEMPFREKMSAFIKFIADMMANGRASSAENTLFTSSVDILNDPEIKKIRVAASQRMIGIMQKLVVEGRRQGQIDGGVSDEALAMYFGAFMEIFINPQFQSTFTQRPGIVHEIGGLMMYGLKGD